MEEDFPAAGICGGNWWMHPSKSAFVGGGPSPCSMGIIGHDLGALGSYNWSSCKDYLWNNYSNNIVHSNIIDSSSDSPGDHNSMVFQSHPQLQQQQQQAHSDDHMMVFNLTSSSSSSSPDWNQTLIGNNTSSTGRGEAYTAILEEDMSLGLNSSREIQGDWTTTTSGHPKSSATTRPGRGGGGVVDDDDPSLRIGPFKSISNHEDQFSLDQQISINNNPTATCQGLSSSGFHMGPSSYGYPSSLIHTLFESDPISPPHHHHQQNQQQKRQQSLLIDNRSSMNYFESPPSCWSNSNKISSPPTPLGIRQQQSNSSSGLHFSNNAPYWNASASASFDDFMPSSQPQFVADPPALEEKQNCNNLTAKTRNEEARNLGPVAKKGSEPAFKRPRIETPSPLPTFKVRKEKLGDRITALQQLVSPFGKTDTASVLHEAIEYIRYLHDQVNVLSTPYMKNANPMQHQLQQGVDRLKDPEGKKQDLRSRGLCLVPISSTFPVASETTSDFWTPTFGVTFR